MIAQRQFEEAARLYRGGNIKGAETALREVVHENPASAEGFHNLAGLLWRTGRLNEAATAYRRAVELEPEHTRARLNLGNVLLALGDDEGWALYDERPERRRSEAHRLGFPEWRGEPLDGKRLFVWTEQGFGDQILAARYLPRVAAAEVTVATPSALFRMFSQLPVRAIERTDATPVGPHDYWTLPMSLPRWIDGPLWTDPYLGAPAQNFGGIGVAWLGNALPDPERSLPADMAARLLSIPGARSLQPEDTGARDFQDTAEIIAGLDAIVSIDTSIAHLAGAMGKPLIVLLQASSHDWRWVQPWYPSATMARQARQGDWGSALDIVSRLLQAG